MINDKNFHDYLRCLVKITDEHSLSYEEIPKEFIDYFTLPGISQAINISIPDKPEIDYDKIENYFQDKSFSDFNELATAIRDDFETDYDKLYASFYFVAHHIEYDYERSLIKNRTPLSIQTIFNTKRGVCVEYAKFFRELVKKAGITSKKIKILPFENASKGSGWNSYSPPSEPDYMHESNYIEIDNQIYLSEPTWAAGSSDEENVFSFNYNKSYFLIPYYKGILDRFPKEELNESLNGHFTWKNFTNLNSSNIARELCFESNPFQKITVNDGFYEMQFSFVQPFDTIHGDIYHLEDSSWCQQDSHLITYDCLAKNLPSHQFSLSKELRCRYKLTILFPEKGEYRVRTFVNEKCIFTSYFDVKRPANRLNGILGCQKEKYGFVPIFPTQGLSEIDNGFARIRFAIKLSRADLRIDLHSIKKGTFNREYVISDFSDYNFFSTKIPFNYESDDKDLNDYLVEDWVLVNFPEDGRWEVEIFFDNGGGKVIYGVSYFFDVTGTKNENNIFPFFDLPKNREPVPIEPELPSGIRLEPSGKLVIKHENDFYINAYSKSKISVQFKNEQTQETVFVNAIGDYDTDEGNIKRWEYSVNNIKEGYYTLYIYSENSLISIGYQKYFIIDSKVKKSHDEKVLMNNLKKNLEGNINYCNDIDPEIRKNVEKMVQESIKNNDDKIADINIETDASNESESEEEKEKLKNKIISLQKRASNLELEKNELNKKVDELGKQKEEQEKHSHSLEQEKNELNRLVNELEKQKEEQENRARFLEQEKNEISNKLNDLMKQKENLNNKSNEQDKEESEMITKLKELEKRKQELEKRTNNLEQENDDLNNKFNEIAKQKEEQEKHARSLEQEKNELDKKVSELEKQKEEMIENMTKEKSIADSKIQSFEMKIRELENEMQKQENHSISLEQEKIEISSKLNEVNNESNKSEMIAKLKELENQTDLLEKEKKSMNDKINELIRQKEEQENHAHSLELKNNEINLKLEELMKQQEDMNNESFEQEQESNEMVIKLRDLEQRKQELENQANNLEQEKDDLNNKFNEIAKQKEEQEKRAHSLEQEKNELNKKVSELEKQKEEIIENMSKEKSIADSKVKELMKQKEEQENRAKHLEQEKDNLSKKVIKYKEESLKQKSRTDLLEQEKTNLNKKLIELEKQNEEIISRERSINLKKNMSKIDLKSREPNQLAKSKAYKSQITFKKDHKNTDLNQQENTQKSHHHHNNIDDNQQESSQKTHHHRNNDYNQQESPHQTHHQKSINDDQQESSQKSHHHKSINDNQQENSQHTHHHKKHHSHSSNHSPTQRSIKMSSSDEKHSNSPDDFDGNDIELLRKSAHDPSYIKTLNRVTSKLSLRDSQKYFKYTLSKFSEKPSIDHHTGAVILQTIRKLLHQEQFYNEFKSSSSFFLLPFGSFSDELFLIIRDFVQNHPDIFSHENESQVTKSLVKSFIDDPQKGLSVTITASQNYNKDMNPLFETIQKDEVISMFRNDSKLFTGFLSLVVFMCQHNEENNCDVVDWFKVISNFLPDEKEEENLLQIYCTLCYLRDSCETKHALNLPIKTMIPHLRNTRLQGKILALLVEANPDDLINNDLISVLFEIAEKCQNLKASLVLMNLANCSEKHASLVLGSGEWMIRGLPKYTETLQLFLVVFDHRNLRGTIAQNPNFVRFMKKIVTKLPLPGTITICTTIIRRIGIDSDLIQRLSEKGFISVFIENAKMFKDEEKVALHSLLLFIHAIASVQFCDEFSGCLKLICNLLKNDPLLSGIASHVVVTLAKYPVCKEYFIKHNLPEFFKEKIREKKEKKLAANGKVFLKIINDS